ncbi:hypothetical protein CBW58_06220 [Yersinia frederiksenii]|nr:hypothetical protein CBW58_06220 [Yersinia frederiksenii]
MLLAILTEGSAHHRHVLRVRSGVCALSMLKISAAMTLIGRGYMAHICICLNLNEEAGAHAMHAHRLYFLD